MKELCVNDILTVIHRFAPPSLAYDWDNVGFLLGDASWPVKRILISLDLTPNTLQKALRTKADLIVTHHPLIFRPIKKITNPLYLELIRNNIAVISAHTNFDVAPGGVNSKLADIFGLTGHEIVSPLPGNSLYQVTSYIPTESLEKIKSALFEAGAGHIGNYSHCLNSFPVKGQFRPLKNSNPTQGTLNKIEYVDELKIEFMVNGHNLNPVVKALKKTHPYETPAFAVFPQDIPDERFGLGIIGKLENPLSIRDFAEMVKLKLSAPAINLWLADKSENSLISKIAVCGGGGGSLIKKVTGKADLFLAGELGYHNIIDSRIPLIEAGHFHTEFPALEILAELLKNDNLDIEILPRQEHEINSNMLYL